MPSEPPSSFPRPGRDPRALAVGDRIRFVSLPAEWRAPGFQIDAASRTLMRTLITRRRSSRVARIDDASGYPWINARTRQQDGSVVHHEWLVTESTGWVAVRRRA